MIEEAGAVVVADDLCMGSRYFSGLVDGAACDSFGGLVRVRWICSQGFPTSSSPSPTGETRLA